MVGKANSLKSPSFHGLSARRFWQGLPMTCWGFSSAWVAQTASTMRSLDWLLVSARWWRSLTPLRIFYHNGTLVSSSIGGRKNLNSRVSLMVVSRSVLDCAQVLKCYNKKFCMPAKC